MPTCVRLRAEARAVQKFVFFRLSRELKKIKSLQYVLSLEVNQISLKVFEAWVDLILNFGEPQ